MEIPNTKQKIKQSISRYHRAFKKEIITHGFISDGYGKRYLLFSLYFVLNDLEKSAQYFEWFDYEFPTDTGEPVMYLCWAVSLHRMGEENEARKKLAMLLLSNIYFIPRLLSNPDIEKEDMWHSSNFEEFDYFDYLPDAVYEALTDSELEWIEKLYNSDEFQKLRKTHVEIYKELQHETDHEKRRVLVDLSSAQWEHLYGMPFELINN